MGAGIALTFVKANAGYSALGADSEFDADFNCRAVSTGEGLWHCAGGPEARFLERTALGIGGVVSATA